MLEPRGCLDKPQEIYKPVGAYSYPSSPQSFGDIGYRRPVRQRRAPDLAGINNTRNGLQ